MARLTRRYHLPSAVRPSPARIEPETARRLVADGAVLVDVRRHDDPSAHLEGAVRIPPDEMPARSREFRRDQPIVLACT
jgi:rhodanese-related sulfurtransferase